MTFLGRPLIFYVLAAFFTLFVLFLYGPMFAIFALSFQGPQGGLTFPMNGLSLYWFEKLFAGGGIVDIGAAFRRSLVLGVVVLMPGIGFTISAGITWVLSRKLGLMPLAVEAAAGAPLDRL